ncbi:hypothetical protein ACHHYP_13103 [Achlya hypogyna]|uniref:Uncharacterized protein n=1 Tax=Achlya hypogyna TaxID=1202772 RepID=A0A1V9YG03_ACHHY|nr:hypothetical protein ACHHYP_13103 [Achlya hypogyna]
MKTLPHAKPVSAVRQRQLLHDRLAKRKARQLYLTERAALVEMIQLLTCRYFAIKGTLLPWREVLRGLKESCDESIETNDTLRVQVAGTTTMVNCLRRWFQTMEEPSVPPVRLSQCLWMDVTLARDAPTRLVGYDWIAKQLYFATRDRLHPGLFPQPYEESIKVEWGPQGRKLVLQKIVRASQEDTAKALWAVNRASATEAFPIPGIACGDMEVLHEDVGVNDRTSYVLEQFGETRAHSIKVFHKRFKDEDRILMAYRTISLDESVPAPRDPEEYQEWNEIRRITESSCLVRTVNFLEPRKAYDSIIEYMAELYPDLYHRSVAAYASDVMTTVPLEQYLHHVMLARGAWIARDHFEHFDRVVASVIRQPEAFHY